MTTSVMDNLGRYLDLLAVRQRLVASNIANADTPGYKTRDIDFQFEYLSSQTPEAPRVIEVPSLRTKNDGNNVNLDREARLLAENALRFSIAGALVKSEIRMLRTAIQEGK
jgi:flagellar basal-body rod protein FlgB